MIDWNKWKPNVDGAIAMLAHGGNQDDGNLYMETGSYKPWSAATINALKRRGYRVDTIAPSVFLLHAKGETA
jgi:hypothetical protein